MNPSDIHTLLGNTDIYLIDQILKGRYSTGDVVLDAGCGTGRNLHWFIRNNIMAYGIDADAEAIRHLQQEYKWLPTERFSVSAVENMSFLDGFFDHVISSAVLHFARSETHFMDMITEMLRVLKPGGTLFIRMATDIGIEGKVVHTGNGVYSIPDGSTRFLLTRPIFNQVMQQLPLFLLEDFKSVNVADIRCMSTLVLAKQS